MLLFVGGILFLFYFPIVGKPYPFKWKKKKKKQVNHDVPNASPIEGDFKDLIGVKQLLGSVVELKSNNKDRVFLGAIKTEPINYLLRSHNEQEQTDKAYETLLAQLNLGPGREVEIIQHLQSRPIDLSEQLQPYDESFHELNPIAQKYAQSMFFPYMESWQETVDDFAYQNYFLIPITYKENIIEDLDEDALILKVQNEFERIGGTIKRNYESMGGRSRVCGEYDLYEALYFAVNKKNGSLEHFKSLMRKDGILSPFVNSEYKRDAIYIEEEETTDKEVEDNETVAI